MTGTFVIANYGQGVYKRTAQQSDYLLSAGTKVEQSKSGSRTNTKLTFKNGLQVTIDTPQPIVSGTSALGFGSFGDFLRGMLLQVVGGLDKGPKCNVNANNNGSITVTGDNNTVTVNIVGCKGNTGNNTTTPPK